MFTSNVNKEHCSEFYNRYHNDPEFREKIKERQRERYRSNPEYREKLKKYRMERYRSDPEYRKHHLELVLKWHVKNRDKVREYSIKYYRKNRDEINRKRKARYKPKPKNPNRLVHKKISNELIWESIKKYNTRREFRFQDYKMYRLALERHLIRDYVFPDEELKKNIIYKSHTKEYKREYRRMRYHTEPEYRKKAYEYVLNWQHRNKEKIRAYKRKYYLKKHGKKS